MDDELKLGPIFLEKPEKIELNLDNPIFVMYVQVDHLSRQRAEETLLQFADQFNKYSNITTWIVPSNQTKLECIYEGGYIKRDPANRDKELNELMLKINERIDVLSQSHSFEDFKMNLRDWRRISKIL